MPKTQALSGRELQVLEMVSHGHTNDSIATSLGIAAETVKTHIRHVLWKLGADSRAHAVGIALRRQLLK